MKETKPSIACRLYFGADRARPQVAVRHDVEIARLFAAERRIERERRRLREKVDRALVAARRAATPHKLIAAAIIEAAQPLSADEMERVEVLIRQRTMIAQRRVRSPHGDPVALPRARGQAGREQEEFAMEPIIKRKVVTEYEYLSPEETAALDGCEPDDGDDDEDDESEELESEELEGDEAEPAPIAKPRR